MSNTMLTRSFRGATFKALLSPQGAYLISDLPKGGLIERRTDKRGGYSQNQVTGTYLFAFQFFIIQYFAESTSNFTA